MVTLRSTSRGQPSDGHKKCRNRPTLSCVPCRNRKSRCDRQLPCSGCRDRKIVHLCNFAKQRRRVSDASTVASSGSPQVSASSLHSPSEVFIPRRDDNFQWRSLQDGSTYNSVGTLYEHQNGGIIYKVRQSQWSSALPSLSEALGTPITSSASSNLPSLNSAQPDSNNRSTNSTKCYPQLTSLPSKQHCKYLVSRFFAVFSPLIHVLHDPTFHLEYENFLHDPKSVPLSWLALLFTILSLATMTLDDDDWVLNDLGREADGPSNIQVIAAQYRKAAMSCLEADDYMVCHRLSTLQCLILMIYAINHSKGSGASWALLGLTAHIAISLGCHIDGESLGINCIEAEQRRRCWAGMKVLYMTQALSFGNVGLFALPRFHVKLPMDVNDEDIYPDSLPTQADGPTQMTYMLLKVKLYSLVDQISGQILGVEAPTHASIAALDTAIESEQAKWDAVYHLHLQSNKIKGFQRVHWNILHSHAHQIYLLIHRPLFGEATESRFLQQSRARCITSAIALLDIHALLSDERRFHEFRWYGFGLGSFHAFHGAVTLAAAILQDRDSESCYQMQSVLNETINRFQTLSARSPICAKAYTVLKYLQLLISDRFRLPLSSESESSTPLSAMLTAQLQAARWISPATMNWEKWNQFIEETEF
ncbi:fungal-specific transcription factor domain-containing protein [Trichoderma barbatum]